MSDLRSQLHDYVESTIERVDVEDVVAAASAEQAVDPRPTRRLRPVWVAAGAALLVVLAVGVPLMFFRSGNSPSVVDQPTATTTVDETSATTSAAVTGVTVTKDIVYLELNGHEYLVDVYAPDGDGPWPVVVALHAASVYKGHATNTLVAEAAAEAGILVFAPNWVAEWPALFAMDAAFVRGEPSVLPCALAFAQQEAATYGGDASRTVVYGFAGGGTGGAQYVLGPNRDLTSGCLAQTPPVAPVGAVLGDAEYYLHASWWNGAFDKDIEEMQTIIAETVDPAMWGPDLPERFHLWAAADGSYPELFDDPWDEDGWFAQRDPDGTIRRDLDELGELDDGIISYIDEGLLLSTAYNKQASTPPSTYSPEATALTTRFPKSLHTYSTQPEAARSSSDRETPPRTQKKPGLLPMNLLLASQIGRYSGMRRQNGYIVNAMTAFRPCRRFSA